MLCDEDFDTKKTARDKADCVQDLFRARSDSQKHRKFPINHGKSGGLAKSKIKMKMSYDEDFDTKQT